MYNYETEKKNIFTEEGQVMFLKIRDNTHKLLKQSGAVMMGRAMNVATGDSWTMMACVDRLVELNEISELENIECAGQYRVFISANKHL